MYDYSITHYPIFVKRDFAVDCKKSANGQPPKKIPVSAHTGKTKIIFSLL